MGKVSRRPARKYRLGRGEANERGGWSRRCWLTCRCGGYELVELRYDTWPPPDTAFSDPQRICRRCGEWRRLAGLPWANHPPGTTIADETIDPARAASLLACARSVEGPNDPLVVARYAEIMRQGRWEHQGVWHPIVIDGDGRVPFGLQRLEAVVASGATIEAPVARWPPGCGKVTASRLTWRALYHELCREASPEEREYLAELAVEAGAHPAWLDGSPG